MSVTPLSDCTNAAIQAMNKSSQESVTVKAPPTPMTPYSPSGKTTVKRFRHNPYASVLSTEEGSLRSPMSSFTSPFQWLSSGEPSPYEQPCYFNGYGAAAYANELSTPYISYSEYPDQVNRPLFGANTYAAPYTLPEATTAGTGASLNTSTTETHSQAPGKGSPTATPMKSLGRIYVGGRPKPVRRRHTAEVTVALRGGEANFRLVDVYGVFPSEVTVDKLPGNYVIVEGDRGIDMGHITAVVHSEVVEGSAAAAAETETSTDKDALPKVLRLANENDMVQYEMLDQAEAEALIHCRACITAARMSAAIHVERAIFQFDYQKLTLQYTSDAYVDFKNLTRSLHNHHKCRIWMHQLNRDAIRSSSGNGEKRQDKGNGNRKNGAKSNNANQSRH